MSDEWKTIRVPKDVYDDAKVRKEEHGVTWGEYVNPHAWHSVFDEPTELPEDREAITAGPDPEEVAQVVVERLEGSKPLEDMAFDDWFEPNHAQTVALKIVEELEGLDLEFDASNSASNEVDLTPVLNRLDDLEAELPRKVREELR